MIGVWGLTPPYLLCTLVMVFGSVFAGEPPPCRAVLTLTLEIVMKPSRRFGVHKGRAAKKFRRSAGRTKSLNFSGPMRGGIRL